jgi:hypothetical protein
MDQDDGPNPSRVISQVLVELQYANGAYFWSDNIILSVVKLWWLPCFHPEKFPTHWQWPYGNGSKINGGSKIKARQKKHIFHSFLVWDASKFRGVYFEP